MKEKTFFRTVWIVMFIQFLLATLTLILFLEKQYLLVVAVTVLFNLISALIGVVCVTVLVGHYFYKKPLKVKATYWIVLSVFCLATITMCCMIGWSNFLLG